MINRSYIGRRIAKLRAEKKISQQKLGEDADVSRNYISNIENGKVAFSIDVLLKIADGMGVEPYQLLTDQEVN